MFKKIQNKDQIFIIFGTILLVTLSYPFLIQTLPPFTDMVFSRYSTDNSVNKNWELFVIKGIIFINVVISSVYCYKTYKKQNIVSFENTSGVNKNISNSDFITLFLISTNILNFVVTSKVNTLLLDLLILWFVALVYDYRINKGDKKYIKGKIVVLFFLIKLNVVTVFMVMQNLFYLGVSSSPFINTAPSMINMVSYMLFVLALVLVAHKHSIDKVLINAQMILPILTLVFLGNFYTMAGSEEVLYKAPPTSYIVLIVVLTIIFIIGEIIHKRKHYDEYYELEYNDILSVATLCILALYISVNIGNYTFVSDIWHNGERLVPYQQADTFSKTLFKDFYPSSGLYAYATGFVMDKFFNNNYFELNFVYSFRDIIIILISTILLLKVVGKYASFYIILMFFFNPTYERAILIVPSFLLLSLPKIKKDEIVWISIWSLCCLFGILYYPLYGAAFSVATLPIAIYMGYKLYVKYKNKIEISNLKQKIGLFVFACIIILLFLPLMLRELYNVYLFSDQTVTVEAVTIFGNAINAKFSNFLASERLNTLIYRIMLMSVLIITPSLIFTYIPRVWFLMKQNRDTENANSELNSKLLTILLTLCFIFVTIIISYSYTLVRIDEKVFVSRSNIIYTSIIGFLFFYTMYKLLTLSNRRTIYDLGVIVTLFIIVVVSSNDGLVVSCVTGTFNTINLKTSVKNFDDNYVYFEDEQIANLGSGIINQKDLNKLVSYKDYIEKFNTSVWLFNADQAMYYIFDLDTNFISASTTAAATKDMQEWYFEKSLDTMPNVIFDGGMLNNYYLTKSFIDYGYIYLIDENNKSFFMKEDFFNDYYSKEQKDNLRYSKSYKLNGRAMFLWANSLDSMVEETIEPTGVSMDNLNVVGLNQLAQENEGYIVQNTEEPYIDYEFDNSIVGFDNDIIYLEIDINDLDKNLEDNGVQIFYKTTDMDSFDESRSINFDLIEQDKWLETDEPNKYLIPIGPSIGYLNSDIDALRVRFNNLGVGSSIKISNIDFYRYPSYYDEHTR